MKSSIWDNSGKNIFKFIPGWESQPRRLEILNGRLLLETMAATGKFATLTPGFALLMGRVTTPEFRRSGNRVPFSTDSFPPRAKDMTTVSWIFFFTFLFDPFSSYFTYAFKWQRCGDYSKEQINAESVAQRPSRLHYSFEEQKLFPSRRLPSDDAMGTIPRSRLDVDPDFHQE